MTTLEKRNEIIKAQRLAQALQEKYKRQFAHLKSVKASEKALKENAKCRRLANELLKTLEQLEIFYSAQAKAEKTARDCLRYC